MRWVPYSDALLDLRDRASHLWQLAESRARAVESASIDRTRNSGQAPDGIDDRDDGDDRDDRVD